MNAVSSTCVVTYSDSTNKFTISRTGTLSLLWNSGTNKSRSVAGTIGFDDTADDTGSSSYTADDIAIHTEEWIVNDLGSAQNIQAYLFKKHNLTSGATAKIQGHTADSWGSPSVDVTLGITADITVYFWSSAQNYRYWRHYIQDPQNSEGYVEFGRMFMGGYFSPEVNFRRDYKRGYQDPSQIHYSDGGQISTNKKTKFRTLDLVFEYTSDTDLTTFDSMWDTLGLTEEFFFTRDRDKKNTTTTYMKIASLDVTHIIRDELFTVTIRLEGLR
jgi:hypothetical protein